MIYWDPEKFKQALQEWAMTAAALFVPALIAFGNGWKVGNPASDNPNDAITLVPNLDSWKALAAALIAAFGRGAVKAVLWYLTGTKAPKKD